MLWICSLYFLGFQGKGLVGTCIFHCLGLLILCVENQLLNLFLSFQLGF